MNLGASEILIILGIIILLFGAKKLPDLARGSGQALRIFKSETKGLMNDDDKKATSDPHGRPVSELGSTSSTSTQPVSETTGATAPVDERGDRRG